MAIQVATSCHYVACQTSEFRAFDSSDHVAGAIVYSMLKTEGELTAVAGGFGPSCDPFVLAALDLQLNLAVDDDVELAVIGGLREVEREDVAG